MAYENAVQHWERTGGEQGIPPVPAALDEDLFCIQVGKELGIPAISVPEVPEVWIMAVRTLWAWRELDEKRRARGSRSNGAKGTPGGRGAGPRGRA